MNFSVNLYFASAKDKDYMNFSVNLYFAFHDLSMYVKACSEISKQSQGHTKGILRSYNSN